MARAARLVASATIGSLIALGAPMVANAQSPHASPASASVVRTSPTGGAILGSVTDNHGQPIANAVVSAVGASTTIAVSDKNGHFEFGPLAPGPYLLRAHLKGYTAPRSVTVRVTARAEATSAITLAREDAATPILTAGFASGSSNAPDAPALVPVPSDDDAESVPADDHSETAWRIRHARRSVLKDVTIPPELLTDDDGDRSSGGFVPVELLGKAVESPAHLATSLFADAALSGQVNLLTTGSFDTPQDFFSTDMLSRNIAYVRVGAPVGVDGNWTARGAVNQADISSWIAAGSYTTRSRSARHQYNVGLSYSTQRYDGGNLLTLRDMSDNSRNVGTVYGYDTFKVTPLLSLEYGGSYARYDYLKDRSLISPRIQATITPVAETRILASVSRHALAPGAEEFLPPGDSGIWLPPQRTFSSVNPRGGFNAEQTLQTEVAVERDFGASTIAVRAFRQRVDDQLVTVFGAEIPGQPVAKVGHYVVGNMGDAEATGYAAAIRTVIANRLHGSVEYSSAMADTMPTRDVSYLMLVAPSTAKPFNERLHDISTSLETEVPETATRILVLYRIGNGFARPANAAGAALPGVDSRFDVQVRQSLPFMNFSCAKWEMLLAVRNFFREAGSEQSLLDERVAVRPPKRVVGGVTLRF